MLINCLLSFCLLKFTIASIQIKSPNPNPKELLNNNKEQEIVSIENNQNHIAVDGFFFISDQPHDSLLKGKIETDHFNINEDHENYKEMQSLFNDLMSKESQVAFPELPRRLIVMERYEELLKRIMIGLFETEEEEEEETLNLDFYSKDFAGQLLNILNSKEEIIKELESNDPFWNDLARLLFKWVLYIKSQFSNDEEFEEIMGQIGDISSIMERKGDFEFPIQFDLNSEMNNDEFETLKELIDYELAEKNSIFERFSLALNNFYNSKRMKGELGRISRNENKRLKKLDCEKLKNDHFEGDFINDPLFEYLIVFYDPWGEMRQECFPGKWHRNLKLDLEFEMNSIHFENLKINGPKDLKVNDANFANSEIIDFLIQSNRRFSILEHEDLLNLLERIKPELLSGELLEKIVEFKLDPKPHWDQNTFEKYLMEGFKDEMISEEKYYEYLELFEFPSKPLKSIKSRIRRWVSPIFKLSPLLPSPPVNSD